MTTFRNSLERYLKTLTELRNLGASEATIRDAFLEFLKNAFPNLEQMEPILLEQYIPGLKVRGGYADAFLGDLIFEFKRRLDDVKREEGKKQLTRYLENQQHPEQFFGILTDGEVLEVYVLRKGELYNVDKLKLDLKEADKCHLWLDCYLFHEKAKVPTAEDVVLRFGEKSPTFLRSIELLYDIWESVKDNSSVKTKFAEWQNLLAIVYGSGVGNEDLFLRHTYLSLFARVLAFVALKQRNPNDEELSGIITGETFERMGLDNFVSEDFFAWVKNDERIKDLLNSFAIRLTTTYKLDSINEDLLKELYQRLVDPQTRHDLGEYYTPDWLAELTLRRIGFPSSHSQPSLIDPACGSGTFLFTAIRLLKEAGLQGAKLVEFCASHLAGIDVHPLAVIIARTNFLLALADDLREYKSYFSIPIYMADSLNLDVPDEFSTEYIKEYLGRKYFEVPVNLNTLASLKGKELKEGLLPAFLFPLEVIERPDLLNELIDSIISFSDPQKNESDAKTGFKARLKDLNVPKVESDWWLWEKNLLLMRWLLQHPVTDTVWRFILKNAYRPTLLARRKFSFVVGNPPWLSYRYVNEPRYQKRLRELATKRYKLLSSSDTYLFTHIELATIFFAFCAEHYLANGGTLAFVMPRSILTGAEHHAKFREYYVSTAQLIIDCEKVNPLFNVPACVVIWQKSEKNKKKFVPVLQLEGNLPFHNIKWELAQEYLRINETAFEVPTPIGESQYLEHIKNGACITPRCFWFVRPYSEAKTIDRKCPQLETDSQILLKAKSPWDVRLQGKVESEFLFSTLHSEDLLPFGWRKFSLIILPLKEGQLLSAEEAFKKGKSHLYNWLTKAENAWKQYAKSTQQIYSIYDWLNYRNKLTAQSLSGVYKLVYPASGTHLCACVLDANNVKDWKIHNLSVQGFVADVNTYYFETQTEDEAHYICAILNAPCVDNLIKKFQTRGAFGVHRGKGERHIHRRPFKVLPIPIFNPRNRFHLELAKLSKECHEKVKEFIENTDERTLSLSIGSLRRKVRKMLENELSKIDKLVRKNFLEHK